MITLALAGDTMLGRAVGRLLAAEPFEAVIAAEVRELTAGADACVVNLECCVSDRGARWPAPGKLFFFRAPPRAADALAWLGVDCATLANNHALDFGPAALADTLAYLADAGIRTVGAGANVDQARRWRVISAGGLRLGVLGVTDHPDDFAAGPDRPGVAFADLWTEVPDWLPRQIAAMRGRVDVGLVSPHWGPNMTTRPPPHVRAAAREFVAAGADLVAGHSAHVFHGVERPVLYDLGDFIDDYAVDPRLRNDLGLLFLVGIDAHGIAELEAVPLVREYCRTRIADRTEAAWVRRRFATACAEWGTEVVVTGSGRLVVPLR
ncbi:CapA family protein [Planosporangium flavigriseum]|uniref:Capsule biosynthesis protein n=1 Tax=Planosporangium flavigriseum TaxID=373681 RepID=A0A8J3LT09_9ACTN|nr:CapA family protein [Planosporangium flavigriseum]GIG73404.1 capsule biosynthesis protein [Planosporangium flavigriseum]